MATATDSSLLHLLHRAMQIGTERFARDLATLTSLRVSW